MVFPGDGRGSGTPSGTYVSKILSRVRVDDVTGCWLWTGAKNSAGYGTVRLGTSVQYAHRAMLEASGVPVAGLFACHHCDTPACVNPSHLYAGVQKQNSRDAADRKRWPAQRRDRCHRGHEYTPENTYMIPATERRVAHRDCRTCRRDRLTTRRECAA